MKKSRQGVNATVVGNRVSGPVLLLLLPEVTERTVAVTLQC